MGGHGTRMGWSATKDDNTTHLSLMFIGPVLHLWNINTITPELTPSHPFYLTLPSYQQHINSCENNKKTLWYGIAKKFLQCVVPVHELPKWMSKNVKVKIQHLNMAIMWQQVYMLVYECFLQWTCSYSVGRLWLKPSNQPHCAVDLKSPIPRWQRLMIIYWVLYLTLGQT